jgi:hypothetical protein
VKSIFPKIKLADTNTAYDQLQHVASEIKELLERIENGDHQGIIEESIDLRHSLETFHFCCERDGVDIDGEIEKVIQKNRERNYYSPIGAEGRE